MALDWYLLDSSKDLAGGSLLSRLRAETCRVPQIFLAEVLHVPVRAERCRRGRRDILEAQVEHLKALPIATDPATFMHLLPLTLPLARRHRLSIFDATNLERAIRRSLPLATFDAGLQRAAAAEQIPIFT